MHIETLATLAQEQPCTSAHLADVMGEGVNTVYGRLKTMRYDYLVKADMDAKGKPIYSLTDAGRRAVYVPDGQVTPPRAITKMAGVYEPPKWETRLDIGRR